MASIDIPISYTFQFPMNVVSWKGRTIYQIVSRLRRVTNSNSNPFLPNPVTRYYRREMTTSNDPTSCYSRASQSIRDVFENPGGNYTTTDPNSVISANGLIGTLDPLFPNDKTYLSDACQNCNNNPDNCKSTSTSNDNVCFRPDMNAKRRCRSAGMISRKFVASRNNDSAYFTDNKQYLHSRNRTIYQNDYIHIRQGSSTVKPGTAASKTNVYSSTGLSHCPKYSISANLGNNLLNYVWLDGYTYTITIPDGDYDIYDFNNACTLQQINNMHYFINPANNVKTVLITFDFDSVNGTVLLTTTSYQDLQGLQTGCVWAMTYNVPQCIIPSNDLGQKGFGIDPGVYPQDQTNPGITQSFSGHYGASLKPNYVPLYYKPSNPQYASQGGVSASSRILRVKYNEIQKAANSTAILGQSVANSLAYHVIEPTYLNNLKVKMGYPSKIKCKRKACVK